MIKVRDKWFRILIIVLPFILVLYTTEVFAHADRPKLLRTFISLCTILAICEGSRWLIYNSHRQRLQCLRPWRRTLLVLAGGIALTTLVFALSSWLRLAVVSGTPSAAAVTGFVRFNNSEIATGLWGYSFFHAVFIFLFLFAGFETIYHFARLRYAEKQKEQLEKEKLKAELNQLKGIVNPHFLFNNLNSLSSLISENPSRAEYFLDELTKVFRYLLRNNQAELTTLGQELLFIQSYYHLLQTRYGNGIRLDTRIDRKYEEWQVPPMTLQLLIENAVKHNQLQKEHPLQIELMSTADNTLIVRNTLFKREGVVESTGLGLYNINTRYKMLQMPELRIEKDDQYFTVTIALIRPVSDGQQVSGQTVWPAGMV